MTPNAKANILLVDDQPARLLTYRSVLEELGQNLVCASSGREALERLMHGDFAVVLLDVSMPDMDGFETAGLIHQHPRFERTPIIFVTGVHVTELDRLRGYKAGAVDYVSIPIVPEILRGKVAVLVELYCKRRELSELNRSLQEANERLSRANAALQIEKTRELEALNDTLKRANADLERANCELHGEIRERRRVEHALEQAARHKDEFIAVLAHELRNPLAPIHNAAAVMRLKPLEDRQLRLAREVIERQVAHLTRLVDDLLDVSRITRGKINLKSEPLDLADLIARAVETVQPTMQARGHDFTVAMAGESLRIHGDVVRLTQAIANVLGNAAKFTDSGGRIVLSVHRQHTDVEISVRDSGIGIAPADLSRIFELFAQPARSSADPPGGLGIGLALVHRLIEMHGGEVSAHSEGPGCGSEFRIRLPLLAERPPALAATAAPVESGSAPRRILVVDDNIDALESLAALLRLSGHEVYSASSGALALEAAKRHLPEIALLDIGMPQLDGYQVARRIRSEPWGKDILLVAVTGWGQSSDRLRSQDAGFDQHLVKPVDAQTLNRLFAQLAQMAQAS